MLASLGILFLSAFFQEADTLTASKVLSVKFLPVISPAEQVYVPASAVNSGNVSDLLRRFTGVQVKDYGGAGGLKTINVRSLGSEHIGVFLDGIQIDNAQNMQVDLGRFSTWGLGNVSLYNAQKTLHLQSAKEYAAGASVYLDSEAPRSSGGKVRLRGGSLLTLNPSLLWDNTFGKVSMRLSADYLFSNGKYSFPYFDEGYLTRENGDIQAVRFETLLFGSLPRGQWQMRLYGYGSERGFPGPVIRKGTGLPFSAERQADRDIFAQGSWKQEWTDRYSTAIRFKYSNNYTHYNTHPELNPSAIPYDLHYLQQSGYLSAAQSFMILESWSADLSTDIQYNTLASDAGQFVKPRRTTFTGALATHLTLEKFKAAAHLVYQGAWDVFDTPSAGGWSRENSYRDAWMPSVSLSWKPLEWLETDIWAKRCYRLPSFNDLYYQLLGNSGLSPESAFQAGADFSFSLEMGRWKHKFRICPYYNRVDDKIVAIPTSSQFRWTMLNIGKVDITGLDLKAESSFTSGDWSGGLTLRYSLQRALDHSTPGSLTWGNQIPYIPLNSGSASLMAGWRGWTLAWDSVLTGGRWSRSSNTDDYHLPPWSISSVSIEKTIPKWYVRAGLAIDNIFNTRYQIVQGYPMPGITALAYIEYSW